MADEVIEIPLSSVRWIESINYRGIDYEYVESLALRDEHEEWEPIEVIPLDEGYGIFDGQHRVEAAGRLGLESISTVLRDDLANESDAEIEKQMIEKNIRHGLRSSSSERARLVDLLCETEPDEYWKSEDNPVWARAGIAKRTYHYIKEKEAQAEEEEVSKPKKQKAKPKADSAFVMMTKGAEQFIGVAYSSYWPEKFTTKKFGHMFADMLDEADDGDEFLSALSEACDVGIELWQKKHGGTDEEEERAQ